MWFPGDIQVYNWSIPIKNKVDSFSGFSKLAYRITVCQSQAIEVFIWSAGKLYTFIYKKENGDKIYDCNGVIFC